MRFAVCAVLGFGVIALLLSETAGPVNKDHVRMEQIIATVDAQLAEQKAAEAVEAKKNVRPKSPRLSNQSRRTRDLLAERREERSIQRLQEEDPGTDSVSVREIKRY